MGLPKGRTNNPKGRPKGSGNKDTKIVRELLQSLADENVPRIQEWLDRVAEKDPAKAIDLLTKLLSYSVPQLKAIEHSGEISEGKPSKIILEFGDKDKSQ